MRIEDLEEICRNIEPGFNTPRASKGAADCKPFGAPADPASITPVRMKYSVFRTIHLAFSLRMRMEMEREREMEMEMEMVIFGALKANWEVIFGAPKASWELIFA